MPVKFSTALVRAESGIVGKKSRIPLRFIQATFAPANQVPIEKGHKNESL